MAHLTTFSLQVLLNTLQKKWKKKLQGSYEQNFHCATIPYFHNLKLGDGNKPFYKNCESLFTSHHSKTDILLNEKGELVWKIKISQRHLILVFGPLLSHKIYTTEKAKLMI